MKIRPHIFSKKKYSQTAGGFRKFYQLEKLKRSKGGVGVWGVWVRLTWEMWAGPFPSTRVLHNSKHPTTIQQILEQNSILSFVQCHAWFRCNGKGGVAMKDIAKRWKGKVSVIREIFLGDVLDTYMSCLALVWIRFARSSWSLSCCGFARRCLYRWGVIMYHWRLFSGDSVPTI